MGIFWKSFLWLALFLQRSRSAPSNTDSIVTECAKKIGIENKIPNSLQFCSKGIADYSDCLEKNIYQSEHIIDVVFLKNINIRRLHESLLYICSNTTSIINQNSSCFMEFKECTKNVFKVMKTCYNVIPCLSERSTTCTPDFVHIISRALMMIKSNACVLSHYQFKLRPFYGPELHCYPKVQVSSGAAAAKLGQNYQYFCSKFKKDDVSQCVADNLPTVGSSPVVDDDYIKEVKMFFRDRSELCEYFSRTDYKTCSSVDVFSCQEDLFKRDSLLKPFDDLLKSYAQCVYDKFKPCSIPLARTIKYNLDGVQSNATHLSSGYSLILSYVTIIFSMYFELISCM